MVQTFDISKYIPSHKDKFFVDTNVWFWFTYAASKEITTDHAPVRYQLEKYPQFIESILDAGASLFHCSITLSEIANLIEKTEYELFLKSASSKISRKVFRGIAEERKKVMAEIIAAWNTIKSVSKNLDAQLCNKANDQVISLLGSSNIDANDALFVNVMNQNSIDFILTDDNDFSSVNYGYIFTANRRSLS